MSADFTVHGGIKTEFLVCAKPCRNDCKINPCMNDEKIVKLLEEVIYHLPDGKILSIKPGFIFDGASIPKICWTSIGHPLEHRFIYAALLHDALYGAQLLERKIADQYFYSFLKKFAGVNPFTAWKMYTGVRWFGSGAWDEKTEKQISEAKKRITLTGGEK